MIEDRDRSCAPAFLIRETQMLSKLSKLSEEYNVAGISFLSLWYH